MSTTSGDEALNGSIDTCGKLRYSQGFQATVAVDGGFPASLRNSTRHNLER